MMRPLLPGSVTSCFLIKETRDTLIQRWIAAPEAPFEALWRVFSRRPSFDNYPDTLDDAAFPLDPAGVASGALILLLSLSKDDIISFPASRASLAMEIVLFFPVRCSHSSSSFLIELRYFPKGPSRGG